MVAVSRHAVKCVVITLSQLDLQRAWQRLSISNAMIAHQRFVRIVVLISPQLVLVCALPSHGAEIGTIVELASFLAVLPIKFKLELCVMILVQPDFKKISHHCNAKCQLALQSARIIVVVRLEQHALSIQTRAFLP